MSYLYKRALLLVLLAGTFGVAINFAPVMAIEPPYYLTIKTSPIDLPTEPAIGVYKYDNTAWQNVTAPLEYIVDGTKHLFLNWIVVSKTDDYDVTSGQMWVHVDQDKTATAYYKVPYKLTVETPYSKPCSQVEGEGWVEHPPDRWLDANTKVKVGVPVSEVVLESNRKAIFEKWVINGIDDGTNRISDWFFMDGPKTAVVVWKIQYYLHVKAAPPESIDRSKLK